MQKCPSSSSEAYREGLEAPEHSTFQALPLGYVSIRGGNSCQEGSRCEVAEDAFEQLEAIDLVGLGSHQLLKNAEQRLYLTILDDAGHAARNSC